MTLAELIAKENPVRHCQECGTKFTDGDFVDYYCKLCSTIDRREMGEVCQSCFAKWESETGKPLERYAHPTGDRMCVCAPCGMVFTSLSGFEVHRKGMKCNSPAKMNDRKRPLVVKDGMWSFPPPAECHYLPDQLS